MSCILIKSGIFYAVDLLLIESTMDIVKKEVIHETALQAGQSMHQKNSHLYIPINNTLHPLLHSH